MITYRKVSLEDTVVSELQDISRMASAKENRTVTLSELVSVGLGHVRMVFKVQEQAEHTAIDQAEG